MTEEIKNETTVENKPKKEKKTKSAKHEKKPRSGKFNLLDALILLCVLAVAVLVFFVYSPSEIFAFGAEEANIIYVIRVSGVPADYAGAISEGDVIYDSNGYKLGVVASNVEVEPHAIYEYRENADGSGGIVPITHPDLVELLITVSAKAERTEDGYAVDGMRIAIEAEYELILPRFESKGVCVSLSEEKTTDAGA